MTQRKRAYVLEYISVRKQGFTKVVGLFSSTQGASDAIARMHPDHRVQFDTSRAKEHIWYSIVQAGPDLTYNYRITRMDIN